jgi:hypothetical protein
MLQKLTGNPHDRMAAADSSGSGRLKYMIGGLLVASMTGVGYYYYRNGNFKQLKI